MSPPMTPAQLIKQYKKYGVDYHENEGWRKHDRRGHGPFININGVMIHHVGDDASDNAGFRVLWFGRSDLPGPLCHVGIRDNGKVECMSAGRANHAGGGDPRVLQEVIAENYGSKPTPPRYHNGQDGSVDGNARFYGAEIMYSGGHAPTAAAYNSTVLWAASICDFYGWSSRSVIAHKEWSNWKIDPGGFTMPKFRNDVTLALRNHA